jgi:glycosyltransferase involved in cell wall biosynthesis
MNRWAEHENIFYSKNKVSIICPIYKSYPQIISSMITQTYTNWELHLVHDGESDDFLKKYVSIVNDDRIKFLETKERWGQYGHPIRQKLLKELIYSDSDYILITNGDNYHTPNCLEKLVNGFEPNIVATFCESMVHSYFGWKNMDCHLSLGHLDCACVMVRKDIACSTGWNDVINHSSDWTYFEDIAKVHGWDRFKKVEGCLLIHN